MELIFKQELAIGPIDQQTDGARQDGMATDVRLA